MTKNSKFFICTFGCRCNQADSDEMRARLRADSLEETGSHADADLIVVNSCTVTGRADQQVRQAVRRYHRENPGARIVVTGCYAEREPQVLAAIPGVSRVLGNADRRWLAEVWAAESEPETKIRHSPLAGDRDFLLTGARHAGGRTRPFLKIQDGCDARCSYCIVPSVRGPGRSAPPEEVFEAVRLLVDGGYQEIVLTGVHLASYGRRLKEPARLADVLRRILEIPGLGRLRLSSIEPMRFDRTIVELAVQYPAFAPHFHIPMQSGSDRILRLMRRPYRVERVLDLLEFIRARLPGAGLGTDLLAGFPGETDEDFAATVEAIRRSPLSYLHVFPFSPREGTQALSLPGCVPPRIVQERCRILRAFSKARNLEFRKQFVGKVIPALSLDVEEEMGEGVALTENYIHARIAGPAVAPNKLIRIRIDEVFPNETRARLA